LRALALIQKRWPDALLTVAGDGPQREQLRQLARDISLRNVRFVGRVPPEHMPALYVGDYERQFFEEFGGSLMCRVVNFPKRFNIPKYALRHLSYSDKPVSRAHMKDNTASGVIVVLTKGSAQPASTN